MSIFSRRQFLSTSAAVGLTTAVSAKTLRAANANDEINLGFISCGGRAGQLMGSFDKVEGINVAGLCDVDKNRLGKAQKRYPQAQGWTDVRDLLASDSIDAVVIATCNHWHCLAAIWAMQAGKDVYVEKPLSHSQWEGQQTVAAARKYNRICQIGTQQRSDPMQAEIKKFLHQDKALGEIMAARVNRYGIRGAIGKRDKPLQIDKNVAYDLWLGPAQDQPIYRDKLHYDWHWDWNTGSGEMGNWGVHVLDDLRNNVFQDSVALPRRIMGGGGRLVWNDAGQTPNVHFAYFDTGSIPVIIGLSNLPAKAGAESSPQHPGPNSGYIAYCEGGRLEGQRGRATAFDSNGQVVRQFKGNSGNTLHQANFIDAVRQRDPSILKADVAIGNDSTGWCNLANIAFRAAGEFDRRDAASVDVPQWRAVLAETAAHLKGHGLSLAGDEVRLSGMLTLDEKTQRFVGTGSEQANRFLKRSYRDGFEVPSLV